MNESESIDGRVQKQQQIYKRVKLLGTGTFGRAFLVRQLKDDSLWVIKQINIADMEPIQQQNAVKQAKILGMLQHPNIVKLKQAYRTSKMKLNIVMQYADGGDLAAKIKEAKASNKYFQESQILGWFTQICLGVKHIHDRKIIHRDLKGQNIFLTSDNCVKIGDFGVSKILEHTLSKAKTVVGSPYYLSPEIIENKPYSLKTDIWSLGALLFELCALAPPFTANNLQFLALKIVKGSYPQIPNKYSNQLKYLIKSMLHTKEHLRPNITQILSSKIIQDRMSSFVKQSQINHQIPVKQETKSLKNFFTLKPPPNLMMIENNSAAENKSEIYIKDEKQKIQSLSPNVPKTKTPHLNNKKGPNNFFNRPSSSRKVQENHKLSDLMQIKPSNLEVHQKLEKPVIPLPLHKPPILHQDIKRNASDLIFKTENLKDHKVEEKINSPIPSSGFAKKRNSVVHGKIEKEKQKVQIKNEIKKPNTTEINARNHQNKKEQEVKKNKKPVIIRKKSIKPKPQIKNQIKLEVCSQEAKKAIAIQKKAQKQKQPPKKKVQPKPTSKQTKKTQNQRQMMQEEKCNEQIDPHLNPDFYYQDEQFQEYESQIQLSLSDSQGQPNQNYAKMIKQMKNINKIVENAQGLIANLPMFGQSIPQIIEFSNDIRDDDTQLQSNIGADTKKTQENLNLAYFSDHGDLEDLRITLEELFGLENIIFIHQIIEEVVRNKGLDFQEEEVINSILKQRESINQNLLKRHFRTIVTVVGLQNDIL